MRKWYRDLRRTLPPTDAKLRRKFFEEKVGADPELSGSGPAPASAPAGQVARWPGGQVASATPASLRASRGGDAAGTPGQLEPSGFPARGAHAPRLPSGSILKCRKRARG